MTYSLQYNIEYYILTVKANKLKIIMFYIFIIILIFKTSRKRQTGVKRDKKGTGYKVSI